jgi:ribokinase
VFEKIFFSHYNITITLMDYEKMIYQALVGVGGIGSGSFFLLNGNHTLGREESRSGSFIKRNDYCKLHIVSHYVKTLLGLDFDTIPVGKVGDDDTGRRLYVEMREAGLNMSYVQVSENDHTLFSFCFIYPDGSGGNLTTNDSACSKVTSDFVQSAENEFKKYRGKGIALAVPEVSLAARQKLLELGTEYAFFRVASFSSGEMSEVKKKNLLSEVDLLALNLDEAKMVAGIDKKEGSPDDIATSLVNNLAMVYPGMWVTITSGKTGSWAWDGKELHFIPAPEFPSPETDVVSTAGAGDAFLAGVISGLTEGLSLRQAQELGTLVGTLSVTSPHTIHKGIGRKTLYEFAINNRIQISAEVQNFLELW